MIITLLIAAVIGLIPASTFYFLGGERRDTSNVVRDIQLLLSLKGLYAGPPNGSCNAETLRAVEAYEGKLIRSTLPIECSAALLDRLKNDLHNSLGQNAPLPPKAYTGAPLSIVNSEIADVKAQLFNLHNTLKSVQDGYSSYFTAQFQSLTQMGVSAFATAISILIAFSALIGNNLIKDAVKAAHQQEIENSKKQLASMIAITQPQISAAVHTDLSDSFTLLYANLDPDKHRHLYNPYVTAAVDMAQRGYKHAQSMDSLVKQNHTKNGSGIDVPGLDDTQMFVMDAALNNYAYFLSDKTTLKKIIPKDHLSDPSKIYKGDAREDPGELADEAKAAREDLRALLPLLGNALERRQRAPHSQFNDYFIFNLKETLLWVKLHIDKNLFNDFDSQLDDLKTNPIYTDAQRKKVADQYTLHKQRFPELWNTKAAFFPPKRVS
ncbi:hypothetical protein [Methylocystis sp.]|uniref:hypothetical protein n=1 Tax=Methylocystis sp. TaxID=1911079 RepID=UPI002732BBA0|nr:hypothetical protein [Methylocystis sp.]MDP3552640.1 hypothetical protein [Methylocystis sp.]